MGGLVSKLVNLVLLTHRSPHDLSLLSGGTSTICPSGAVTTIASGLQTAVDLLPVPLTSDRYYVIEYSNSFLTGGPGRVLLVDATRGTRLVLADGLRTPTHLALDTRTGDLFVTENTGGRILRILIPH